MTDRSEELLPVIVGVGEINDRPADPEEGLNSAELMAAALEHAEADAGGSWIAQCDTISVVPQISWNIDTRAALAASTGVDRSRIVEAPLASGDTPVRLLNDAANAIGSGEARIVAITGGEALRTGARLNMGAAIFEGSLKTASDLRRKYGLITPNEIYPLYENALRAALGQTLDQGQDESALIWSNMSEVAARSKGAWLQEPVSADDIRTPSPANRPIAFPYTKFMVANASVNQGAAVIVTSLAEARSRGIPDDRLVFIGAGAAAHESDEPLTRADWHSTPSMPVSIGNALALNDIGGDDIDHAELYSCFPCVPKLARRILGWPAERPATVHGGLTFGGGPIANYMTHAIAAMVRLLRGTDQAGLLFANGGHCSHNHTIVLTGQKPDENPFPQDYHFQEEADGMRRGIPRLTDDYEGKAPVETYTVIYDRNARPEYGVVLSRTRTGDRIIARVDPDDAKSIAFLTNGETEPVGYVGINRKVGDLLFWQVD